MIKTKTFVTCDICGETIIGDYHSCMESKALDPEESAALVPNYWSTGTLITNRISGDGYDNRTYNQTHVCINCWKKME